jgi:hypothetical protein
VKRSSLAIVALCSVLRAQDAAPGTTAASPASAQQTTTIEPPFEVATHRVLDLDGDGKAELIAFARDGRVRSWRPLRGEAAAPDVDDLTLDDPAHTLIDSARFGQRAYLIAATPRGVLAYGAGEGGRIASTPSTLIARGKFTLRVGRPMQSSLVQDVNRDGLPDVVLPGVNGCELWLAHAGQGDALPTFQRAATIAVEVSRGGNHEANDLSDKFEASFAIPNIDTSDVNGDGRPDLLVEDGTRRSFHLQRADGSFPLQPDVTVDLAIFKDTTESAGFEFGGTVSGGDDATYEARDLDGDKIPDYVIAQHRKVWVFRGSSAGPQFTEPSAILKAAEDVTAVLVLKLDDDALPELLLIKVQIPTLATLLRGLFGEWDVPIGVVGYKNKGAGRFDMTPQWKNELTMRLPGIIGLIKNPGKLLERVDDLDKRFRTAVRGELNGDGARDVLIVTEDEKALEIWFGRPGETEADTSSERKVREILFDDQDRVWDVDRVLMALGNLAQRRIALQTGGRAADRSLPMRDPAGDKLNSLDTADFDGDGREEILLVYDRRSGVRRTAFDIVKLESGGK